MTRVLVTGGTGFIGAALLRRLAGDPEIVAVAGIRQRDAQVPSGVQRMFVGELASHADWRPELGGTSVLVHSAARVHVMHERSANSLAEFRRVNTAATLNLARQAADVGVERFVFLSSIKVNGEQTHRGCPYTAEDMPQPLDSYGISKLEAEQGLRTLAAQTGMEISIIRPVLVYGPGVKGNFLTMMRWVGKGIPLPFGAIDNRRSLVALPNLVDLIFTCLRHPQAANQTFLVSDGEDLSTTELLRRTGAALHVRTRLVPVPVRVLRGIATTVGKQEVAARICGWLQVDIEKTQKLLSWAPKYAVDDVLRSTAECFLNGGLGERLF